MNEEQNCKLLFGYLRSILYDTNVQELDIEQLDEPFQRLGMGLQFLQHAVEEMKQYSADLSRGNLSGHYPGRDNFLCENLKNIQANLNHLTWQAKQVAQGDYTQHVSYLGEFSEAFNTMIQQLQDRETLLKEEAAKEKQRAAMMQGYNELLVELTRKSEEQIMVLDMECDELLYCNQVGEEQLHDRDFCKNCENKLDVDWDMIHARGKRSGRSIEIRDDHNRVYHVSTHFLEWQGRKAYAHVVRDVTEAEKEKNRLTDKAYHDILTQIGNRLYFEERMEDILAGRHDCILCYYDLDHLKYVNDHYGHLEGDAYICKFVKAVRDHIRGDDIFARLGGDEFCTVFEGCSVELIQEKMKKITASFLEMKNMDGIVYPMSFSYGILKVDEEKMTQSLEDILTQADELMYQDKKKKKERYMKELQQAK